MIFIIDFDGTLAVHDTVDAILDRFADKSWELVEQDWLQGKISAVECMTQQIRMVRADNVTLENFFRGIQLDASFLPFYLHVRHFASVAIVSDGLDHAIKIATRNAALPELPIYANRLHFAPDGIDITFPHRQPDCAGGNGVCKCAIANGLAAEAGEPIVLVGDGKSDACLARSADVVFAKGSLTKYCEQEGIRHHRFQTFADVLSMVRLWPIDKLPTTAGRLA